MTAKVEANLLSPKRNSTSFGVQWLVRQKGGREESRICLPTAVLVAEHNDKLPQPTTHCEEVRKPPAMRTAPSNEVVTFSAPHAQRNTHRDTQGRLRKNSNMAQEKIKSLAPTRDTDPNQRDVRSWNCNESLRSGILMYQALHVLFTQWEHPHESTSTHEMRFF